MFFCHSDRSGLRPQEKGERRKEKEALRFLLLDLVESYRQTSPLRFRSSRDDSPSCPLFTPNPSFRALTRNLGQSPLAGESRREKVERSPSTSLRIIKKNGERRKKKEERLSPLCHQEFIPCLASYRMVLGELVEGFQDPVALFCHSDLACRNPDL